MTAPSSLLVWGARQQLAALRAERAETANRLSRLTRIRAHDGRIGREEKRLRDLTAEIVALEIDIRDQGERP